MGWRWFFFLLFITLGVGMGLLYGWVINPAQYTQASPDLLKDDFRTDYVLMVAERFHTEQNLAQAVGRLGYLGGGSHERLLEQAIEFAGKIGYHQDDVLLMRDLLSALQANGSNSP